MNPKVESVTKDLRRILLLVLLALGIGAIFILPIHENPLGAYAALFESALVGKLKIGTTLVNFTPLLLTSVAFMVAAKVGAFNAGVEDEIFLGGMAVAYVRVHCTWFPEPLLLAACLAPAVATNVAWARILGFLKAYCGVSEVCTTTLMNSVTLYITSYLVSKPISAGVANPQSILVNMTFLKLLKPSNVNAGLFMAIAAITTVVRMLNKITLGYKTRTVGTNPVNARHIGINPKKMFVRTMILSDAIGGLVNCIRVLGTYGYFLSDFTMNPGTNGMLASLIVKNNMVTTPFTAFLPTVLRSGALGMQQNTDVLKSIVDTITAIFIIVVIMELLSQFNRKREAKADAQ